MNSIKFQENLKSFRFVILALLGFALIAILPSFAKAVPLQQTPESDVMQKTALEHYPDDYVSLFSDGDVEPEVVSMKTTQSLNRSFFLRSNDLATFKPDVRPLKITTDSFLEPSDDLVNRDDDMVVSQWMQDNELIKKDRFHWKPALAQSGLFLGIKHGVRLFQKKTYRELGGPFFRDWGNSIKNLRGWNDGDSPFTNNFAHPLQGGVTGWIFINNSDHAKRQKFGKSKEYWKSRFKVMAWSAVWSTQFEFGPISEATIGNVGLRPKNGHSTMAWTDLVMTPTVGTAIVIGEDMVDKYILKNWIELGSKGVTTRVKILRSLLTPTASFSNLLRGKYPWKRDTR